MPTIAELQAYIAATKAPASARNYSAVLQRFADYAGDGELCYDRLTPDFVAGFGNYLLSEGLTPASAGLFQRCLRALLKDTAPADRLPQVKAAFAAVSSRNIGASKALEAEALRIIATADLNAYPSLDRIRQAYMYAIYSGGATLGLMQTGFPEACTLQQQQILRQFRRRNDEELAAYVGRLSSENYRSGLRAIGAQLGIEPDIDKTTEADNYVEAARSIGISPERIAATMAVSNAYSAQVSGADKVTARQRQAARQRVAHALFDLRPRWYAMRVYRRTATELADELQTQAEEYGLAELETFVAPEPVVRPGMPQPSGSAMIQRLLFVHTHEANIKDIKRRLGVGAHLYSYRHGGRPAHIPDADMKLFMLLADAARDTIQYHFPEEGEEAADRYRPGMRARVKAGPFTGLAGIIGRSKDSYKVVLRIETLGGAVITADLPAEFVEPE